MRKFLSQFALTPMQRVDMENFIYTQADKMLANYAGGTWASKTIGDGAVILMLPVADKKAPVTLTNYAFGGSVTTDHLTASAAFSSIVSNWYANLRYEQNKASDAMLEAVSNYGYAVRAAADKLPNSRDFFSFTD